MYRTLTLITALFLLGCTTLRRSDSYHPDVYETDPELLDYYHEKNKAERTRAKAQLRSQDSGQIDEALVERRMLLNRLEKRIATERERELYYKFKPYMASDGQRIRFLQTDSYEAKMEWLKYYKINTEVEGYPPQIQNLIDASDICLGMTREAVIASWGEPDTKEIAGNALYGNERWKYTKNVPTEGNYGLETRFVYFEGGQVSGWEKD